MKYLGWTDYWIEFERQRELEEFEKIQALPLPKEK